MRARGRTDTVSLVWGLEFAESVLAEDVDLDDVSLSLEELQLIDSAGQWASVVGQQLQKVAPGAIQGALTGFMTGGPVGAVAGAAMGGASAYLNPGAASGGAAGAAANPAALQLLAAILRPEVLQALGAMSAGASGAQQVSVAGQQVPVAAFANMLANVAGKAAFTHHANVPSPAAASPAPVRAEELLELLAEAAEVEQHDDASDAWAEATDLADLDRLESE